VWAEPEVVFRIVHVAFADGSPPVEFRDQRVEVALGPNAAFQDDNVSTLTRCVPGNRVVSAVLVRSRRAKQPKPRKKLTIPSVVQMFQKANEWQRQLDAGEVPNQAALAQREDLTRARVTQVLGLLRLPQEVYSRILTMQNGPLRSGLSEHTLRRLVRAHGSRG